MSSNGVLRYLKRPSNGSFPSAEAFFRIRFADCTALSAAPFDCGYSGELVVCLKFKIEIQICKHLEFMGTVE